MPPLKIEQTEDTLTIEGEIDIEFDITGMHPGFPTEDEDIFNIGIFMFPLYYN